MKKSDKSVGSKACSAALKYAGLGYPVAAVWGVTTEGDCACGEAGCTSQGKHPNGLILPNGLKDASTDPDIIRGWWQEYPDANVALTLGKKSGLMEVEFDEKNGGLKSRERLEAELGVLPGPSLRTGGGGYSHLFRHPNGLALRNGTLGGYPGVEVRVNGLRVVPPSQHKSGKGYAWIQGRALRQIAPQAIPDEWLRLVLREPTNRSETRQGEGIPEGRRNTFLTSLAGRIHSLGASFEELLLRLQVENETRCNPPLDQKEVRAIAESISKYPRDFHLTDVGNGQRMVALHGNDVRYVAELDWMVWDGSRWVENKTGEVHRRAKGTIQSMYNDFSAISDADERRKSIQHALKSESASRIRAMIECAQSEEQVVARPADFDSDPMLFNVRNGTLDLASGTLHPHRRVDLLTKMADVDYDPAAKCPKFLGFLFQIFDGNEQLIRYVQRRLGSALSGFVKDQLMDVWHGPGSNGKSTLREAIASILGDYAEATPAETLMRKKWGGIPNDVARLRGARFVTAVEADEGNRLAESLVKQLTGNDKIVARFLFKEYFEFTPEFKLFLITNHLPQISGTDHAIWRRIRLIPFAVTIPDDDQDEDLPQKLLAESSGILNWLLKGCQAWLKDGLGLPPEVSEATDTYRVGQDVFGGFVEECCEDMKDKNVAASFLYEVYLWWCRTNGEPSVSQNQFGRLMTDRGFDKKRLTLDGGTKLWSYLEVQVERRVETKVRLDRFDNPGRKMRPARPECGPH